MKRKSPRCGRLPLVLVLMAALGSFMSSCSSLASTDKRVLQYLNQEGFGKRYVGRAQDQNYVTIGDSILYRDSFNSEVAGVQTVEIDGTILMPEAGSVFVAGMTRAELESFLTQRMSPFFLPTDIKVEIRSGGSRAYYVLGEVENPGRKRFVGDTTIFEAVMDAKPAEHTANLGRVKLYRADPRNPLVIPVNVAAMWDSGDSTYNVTVQEFDIIYVPPTLLKQVADIVSAIIVPVISPVQTIFQTLFLVENNGQVGRFRRN